MANLDNKCLVCGYDFQDNDYNSVTGHYTCPYCGTKKRAGGTDKDFERTSLLTQGFLYLSQSDLVKASQAFTSYIANYNDESNETLKLGNALANCGISTCLNYHRDKLISIIHRDTLPTDRNTNFQVIKEVNSRIYNSVESIREKEAVVNNIHNNSLVLVSLDAQMGAKIDRLLSSNQVVLSIDITSDDCELLLYKNISSSSGLVVYINNPSILTNPYFLSVYYRFKSHKKNVIFLYEERDDIPLAYSIDTLIDINSTNLLDLVLRSVTGTKTQVDNIEVSGTEVVSMDDENITLPTSIVSIVSRAAYQKQLKDLHITSSGLFTVGERAFAESSIERFDVQSKTCDIKIGKDAFCGCKVLKTVLFSNEKIELGIGVFRNCTSLNNISFANKQLKEIPTHTFDGCRVLSSVEIPVSVVKIGKYAFRNTQLQDVTLYSHMKIESKAFVNCHKMHTVIIKPSNTMDLEFEVDSFPSNVKFVLRGKETKELLKYFKKNHPDYKVVLEK